MRIVSKRMVLIAGFLLSSSLNVYSMDDDSFKSMIDDHLKKYDRRINFYQEELTQVGSNPYYIQKYQGKIEHYNKKKSLFDKIIERDKSYKRGEHSEFFMNYLKEKEIENKGLKKEIQRLTDLLNPPKKNMKLSDYKSTYGIRGGADKAEAQGDSDSNSRGITVIDD